MVNVDHVLVQIYICIQAEQGVCPLSHTDQLSNIESNIKCKDACDNL